MLKRLALALGLALALPTAPLAAQEWTDVAAILTERCTRCHSGDFAPMGLDLSSHAGLAAGAWTGPVVRPGAPQESPIIGRLRGEITPRMPLDGPPFLEPAEIETIARWIAAGAPGPSVAPGLAAAPPAPAPADPRADGRITYDEVAPIFGRHCIECHSDNGKYDAPPEGLRLSSLADILAGGERLAVVPGNPAASEIIRRTLGLASPRMPFDGPPWLDDSEIALLRDWIDGGALDAEGSPASVPAGGALRLRGILTGASEIDGAGFVVTGATRIDERPAIGQPAEMRGRVAADGSIVAERLRDR